MKHISSESADTDSSRPPLVSIILPVYNCDRYVEESIQSILDQTYSNLELIIIDDGSTDASFSKISSFDDPRIHVYRQSNHGLASTLNRGISLARGTYVARQDQDDLSHPDRLALQVDLMETNPKCVLLGTWAQIMEDTRVVDRFHCHPTDDLTIRYQLLFNNPFVHSSTMIRRSALLHVGGYTTDPQRQPPEDYELWSRLARFGSLANLPQILVTYRELGSSISRSTTHTLKRRLIMLCSENLAAAARLTIEDPDIQAIASFIHGEVGDLQKPPNFDRIQSILLTAISSLGNFDKLFALQQDAISRVETMQTVWILRNMHIPPWVLHFLPLKTIVKKLFAFALPLLKYK